ncbi:THO complex subunit 3-like [Haliotis rubra]|uniref:THO complex subunit 3-like n=1 Tax=Haliotis rubra TaxID=36100 RepID=UPI001EE6248D|nr:THO complex subunit 3-like [Haliotis rubra]
MASQMESMLKHFQNNNRIRDIQAHSAKVHSVAWSCDGRKLASGSFDKTVSTYSLDRDRLSKDHIFRGHGDSVDQLCWHPRNPELLVTASGDKTVRIWDTRSSKSAATINTKGTVRKPTKESTRGIQLARIKQLDVIGIHMMINCVPPYDISKISRIKSKQYQSKDRSLRNSTT